MSFERAEEMKVRSCYVAEDYRNELRAFQKQMDHPEVSFRVRPHKSTPPSFPVQLLLLPSAVPWLRLTPVQVHEEQTHGSPGAPLGTVLH